MTSPVTICFSTHIHFSHTARLNDWLIFFGYYLACCFLHHCISNLIKQRSDKREQTTDIRKWEKESRRDCGIRIVECGMGNQMTDKREQTTDIGE